MQAVSALPACLAIALAAFAARALGAREASAASTVVHASELTVASADSHAAAQVPADALPAELALEPPFGLIGKGASAPPAVDAAAARIGRKLFFDPVLSVDRSIACASCHRPEHGFAQASATSPGVRGQRTARNAPSLFNRALGTRFMWDGRAPTLVEQVLQPIENPAEMGLPLTQALQRLASDAEYARLFREELGGLPSRESLALALSSFVSTIWIGDSPVDRFQAGEASALSDEERTGLWVYESKGHCWRCHSGTNFSDEALHNTGVGAREGAPEDGSFAITKHDSDRGRFKTPTLRGLVFTAPYMHDGSLATLRDVVDYYARGGNANSHLAPEIEPLELTEDEKVRLVKFLEALSRTSTSERK